MAPKQPHPFFRKGTPEFDRAMAVGTPQERFIWDRIGIAQFTPDDKRLKRVQMATPPAPAIRGKMRAAGDGA